MRASSSFRPIFLFVVLSTCLSIGGSHAIAQDVGVDVGGGAGIFRPKNPETKRRAAKPTPNTRRGSGSRSSGSTSVGAGGGSIEERADDLLEKGNQFRDARRFAEGEAAYQGILKLKPRDPRAAYGLGNIYSDQQRWAEAEKSYRSALEWSPFDADILVALSVVLVQPRTGEGNAKRLADAESFARRAVQLQPKNAIAWDRMGVALQTRGIVNAETEQAYRRAVELDPEFAVAYVHLGRVLKRLGRATEGAPLYEKASSLAKDPATLNLIAESLQAEGQWDSSEPILKRALELDARNPNSLYLLGRLLVAYKRYQEAEPYLKLATEVSARAFQPYNLLGRSYLALERYEEAEVTYERAAGLASPGDRKELAGIYGFAGVGDGFLKAKKKSSAARAYRRALELDPNNKELEQKLSKAQ
ncbi:MAG TPA: tetratricopeptide repeat protein [Pyrinomonadaceae bacterium]|nr:tetratricopeptide repeat protein [Pyrinomonadaceae bacterium]